MPLKPFVFGDEKDENATTVVWVELQFHVRESARRDGYCTCGAPPTDQWIMSSYPSPVGIKSNSLFDGEIDTDLVWNGQERITDADGRVVLRCADQHLYVNAFVLFPSS